jgi:hypothetical protein
MDHAENELLTKVGPGTPAGDTLRKYWLPVGLSSEINSEAPKLVRWLGEELLLFRDEFGRVGGFAGQGGAGADDAPERERFRPVHLAQRPDHRRVIGPRRPMDPGVTLGDVDDGPATFPAFGIPARSAVGPP